MNPNTPRPLYWLRVYGQKYPEAWRAIEGMRQLQGTRPELHWPDHVYVPLAAAYAVVSKGELLRPDDPRILDVPRLGGLAAWRWTKGIYRFHPLLLDELWHSDFSGTVPLSVLKHLPEWALYIELPGIPAPELGGELQGFFAFLEHDLNTGHDELYVVWDLDTAKGPQLMHIVLHLDQTVEEGLRASAQEGEANVAHLDEEIRRVLEHSGIEGPLEEALERSIRAHVPYLRKALSLLFFLSTQPGSIEGKAGRPTRPRPKKTKKGVRLFAAPGPQTWEVGVRVGKALQSAYVRAGQRTGTGAKKRPHVRRAHWHGYWVGPRSKPEERRLELRWLPPILVGLRGEEVEVEDLPAVIWHMRPEA